MAFVLEVRLAKVFGSLTLRSMRALDPRDRGALENLLDPLLEPALNVFSAMLRNFRMASGWARSVKPGLLSW